ncbi:MAG TPA: hypothetical protein VK004_00730 [Ignavibacteria bacterium]|nr:hypothetical protein [Ignavibacteria bacterium]
MNTSGKPTREQLEKYYETTRQYFDDLAAHYKETDPEYYKSVVQPVQRKGWFSGDDDNSAKRGMILVAVAVFLLVGTSVGVFLLLSAPEDSYNPVDEYYKQQQQQNSTNPDQRRTPLRETRSPVNTESGNDGTEGMSNFEKGEFYYEQQAYNQALEYLGQVTPGDENYDRAQKYISEINEMPEEKRSGIEKEDTAPKMNPNR